MEDRIQYQFDGDFLSSLHINSKEELPEGSTPDLLSKLELAPDYMIHLLAAPMVSTKRINCPPPPFPL
jgi:hypothetical protein